MRKDMIAKVFALFMTLVIAGTTTGCGGRKTSLNEKGNKNVDTQKISDNQKKDGESLSSEVQDKKKKLVGKKKKLPVNLSKKEVKTINRFIKIITAVFYIIFLNRAGGIIHNRGLLPAQTSICILQAECSRK